MMKKVFTIVLLIACFSCKHASDVKSCKTNTVEVGRAQSIVSVDTVYKVPDSINSQLFLARYKLERVKYYLNICLKNPSQDKFLKGWIRRAVQ